MVTTHLVLWEGSVSDRNLRFRDAILGHRVVIALKNKETSKYCSQRGTRNKRDAGCYKNENSISRTMGTLDVIVGGESR